MIVNVINTLIDFGKTTKNIDLLQDVDKFIMDLIEDTKENCNNYTNELLMCVGDISFFMKRCF